MTIAWKNYQEEAASFMRSLGLDASTDVTVNGVRTTHDIDVLVRSHHVGFDITWLVECKHWKTPISKLHVLALREIVADVGADRGIILSESGFQSGAIEAANLTNIQVTSLAELSLSSKNDIFSMRLREQYVRIESCKERYWAIPKYERIDHGLRPDPGGRGYNGTFIIELCCDLLLRSFRGVFPVKAQSLHCKLNPRFPSHFNSPVEVFSTLEPVILELEMKLDEYDKLQTQLSQACTTNNYMK